MPAAPGRRTALALATAAAALATAWGVLGAGVGAADAATSGAPAPGSQYVALGDSYAAGYGISPSTNKPVTGCDQSTKDYPHQVAAALHLRLTDVSCSGAVTGDIDQNGQNTGSGSSGGTAPQQDTVLSSKTKLVTVTIGGNDFGFSTIAQNCIAVSPVGGLYFQPSVPNCKSIYDDPTNTANYLPGRITGTVVPHVARVLADIKRKAPNAKVYFVDYPAISTNKAGSGAGVAYPTACFSSFGPPNSFPFNDTDTPFLQQIQQQLNAAIKTQVVKSGDHFVESYPQSLAHSACASTQDKWMNGLTLQLTPSVGAAPGSLHPNLEGADHLAAETLAAIGPYVAPRSTTHSTSAASGRASAGASTSPAAAAATPLANSGFSETIPVTVTGALLVLVGGGLLFAARTRVRRGSHGR